MDLNSHILFEDDSIVAINKPSGIVVHSDGRTKEENVSEWFLAKYPEAKNVGEPIELKEGKEIKRPGIVHRLDRDTSGVLLLAKTEEGFDHLKSQFQNRMVQKKYHVFVYGKLKEDHGSINLPIGKSASDFRKWSAERGAKGEKRDALTYFQVLARNEEVTLIEARPKTGRTHQIRVHFKALHHPVISDVLYARTKPQMLGFTRQALHAREVEFEDLSGATHTVRAPYPEDFLRAFEAISYVPKHLP